MYDTKRITGFAQAVIGWISDMTMRLCVLGSGSSGNCIYVASGTTRIIVDAGLSGKETVRRLDCIGEPVDGIDAICVTHEHDDHVASLAIMQRRFGSRIYANAGTIEALDGNPKLQGVKWHVFATGNPFQVGDIVLEPFSVPHDAYDPVGFVVKCDNTAVGIATDMGSITELIRQRLAKCMAIVIEANHDETMLKDASRPWSLKQRIMGRHGHLSNADAAELVCELAENGLEQVFLAHLSSDCNKPEIALKQVRKALAKKGCNNVAVSLTHAGQPSEVWRSKEGGDGG